MARDKYVYVEICIGDCSMQSEKVRDFLKKYNINPDHVKEKDNTISFGKGASESTIFEIWDAVTVLTQNKSIDIHYPQR